MRVSYLVDGYNLLFHLGLFDRNFGAHALEHARSRLLDYLKQVLGDEDVTVVFDSSRSSRRVEAPQEHQGLHVQYTSRGQEADDVIEETIAGCASPGSLVVISNDRRIRQAARRKGARSWSCDDFLDHKNARPALPAERPAPDRAPPPSREEVRRWLDEFGHLADDPDFKEVFERFPFEDEPEE
jgi:predicted RNA-binding protein with PIN domain